jgi:hypothetical protein
MIVELARRLLDGSKRTRTAQRLGVLQILNSCSSLPSLQPMFTKRGHAEKTAGGLHLACHLQVHRSADPACIHKYGVALANACYLHAEDQIQGVRPSDHQHSWRYFGTRSSDKEILSANERGLTKWEAVTDLDLQMTSIRRQQ